MSKNVSLISTLSDIKNIRSRSLTNFQRQIETMRSAKILDRRIVLLDCKHDYALDELLEEGCGSISKMLDFARRRMFYAVRLKLGEPEMGCSVFTAHNEKNEYIMGRNFDYKDAPCMVVRTAPENGYRSISVVDCNLMLYGEKSLPQKSTKALKTLLAPYLCVDGINEKGVAIAVLELKSAPVHQKTGKKPISTTIMIRTILDKAASVSEAVALFRQYDMNDIGGVAYHFVISDASGEAVLIEYVNSEMKLFYPEKRTEDGLAFISVTNHFIAPDGPEVKRGAGFDRQKTIVECLSERNGIISDDDAMKLLSDVQLCYTHKLGWPVRTLWSAVYNSNALTMDIVAGQDYSTVHRFSVCDDLKFIRR